MATLQSIQGEVKKSPYAELQPWVDSHVWEMSLPKSIDEFLIKYKFPRTGNTAKDTQYQQKLIEFSQKMKGLKVGDQYFAVVFRDKLVQNEEPGGALTFRFCFMNRDGEKLYCTVIASESEQKALDYYPTTLLTSSGNPNVLLTYARHIDFGRFCRYLQQEGFIEYIKGIYDVKLYGNEVWDMQAIAVELDKTLTGQVAFLSEEQPELLKIRTLYLKNDVKSPPE